MNDDASGGLSKHFVKASYLTRLAFVAVCLTSFASLSAEPNGAVAQLAKEVRSKAWIVFRGSGQKGSWDLFLMRPDGSSQRNITNTSDFHEVGARFSSDGKKILYRRVPAKAKLDARTWGTQGELVIANSDGSEPS